MNSAYERLSTPAASSVKLEAAMAAADEASQHHTIDEDGRPYYGKCQYKTGKCFNERTLKRNGEVHSLCEEHRIKQNLIQRRSDRKYQTVHAIRRRERSQRRAVLKKQVSMAVAQQLFYEHQQQKTLSVHLATSAVSAAQQQPQQTPLSQIQHPLHVHAHRPNHHAMGSLANAHPAAASVASLVPPISIPHHSHAPFVATSAEGLASPILSFTTPSAFSHSHTRNNKDDRDADRHRHGKDEDKDDEDAQDDSEDMDADDDDDDNVKREPGNSSKTADGTPTGIDDFTPDAFLNLCCGDEGDAFATFAPILSARAERELWTESDIDFLQTLLLA